MLAAVSPRWLYIVGGTLAIGAGIFEAVQPGQRSPVYYRRLALINLSFTSFVDVMLALGGY